MVARMVAWMVAWMVALMVDWMVAWISFEEFGWVVEGADGGGRDISWMVV